MTEEPKYVPRDAINSIINSSKQGGGNTSTVIKIEDAGSETAKILIPQFGADEDWLAEGKNDWRRFGHVSVSDPYWMSHFMLIDKYEGGDYSQRFVEQFANFNYGVEGRHKKLTVDMQKAVSGRIDQPAKPKRERSRWDKLLGRNKDMEE